MVDTLPTRITLAAAAAHYGRSTRWIRLQVGALSDAALAALRPGFAGARQQRTFDRPALIATLDAVLASTDDAASRRLKCLAGHMGVPRVRDGQGALLCTKAGCRRTVEGRRRLCDVHTTPRALEDRRQRGRP